MIDTEQLILDLGNLGNVLICEGQNNNRFIIVMDNVGNGDEVMSIVSSTLSVDYPNQTTCTFLNGVFKCERNK